MNRLLVACLCALLLGCSSYPRDVDSTAERVTGGTLRVGMIEGAPAAAGRERQLIAALARELHSRPVLEAGSAEPLLLRLEEGELDLVVGTFAAATPWSTRVTFSKPLLPAPDAKHESKAAVRLGEHRWSMVVDRAVARLNAQAGR